MIRLVSLPPYSEKIRRFVSRENSHARIPRRRTGHFQTAWLRSDSYDARLHVDPVHQASGHRLADLPAVEHHVDALFAPAAT